MNTLPPRLPPRPRFCRTDWRGPGRTATGPTLLYAAGALVLVVVGLRILRTWDWPLPGCGFRALTGIPCVGCGSTRALLALSEGDWGAAWNLNPLTSLACAGLGAAALLAGVDRLCGTRLMAGIQDRVSGRGLVWTVAVSLVLNWVYLVLAGRN